MTQHAARVATDGRVASPRRPHRPCLALAGVAATILLAGACTSPGRAGGTGGAGPASGSESTATASVTTPASSAHAGESASTTATGGQSTPPAAAVGRGLQRPAADIPWGEVGRNWFVALWSTSGPAGAAGEQTSLFLVDPAGGRYLVHTWPAAAAPTVIDDWSGDGRRVLLGRAHPALMDLSTGATRALTDVPDIMAAGFTRPSGSGFVLVRPMAVGDTLLGELVRVDAPGARPVELAANTTSWVYAADGRSLLLDGRGELRVVDNSGRTLRAIPAPVDQPCRPVRWWSDSRLLVACGTDLWLLSPSTGAWDRLTAPPTSTPVQTFGNSDGFPLGRASYAQADASCGVGYVARVAADGSTTPVKLPGALSGPSLLLGTDAQRRLAVMSVHSCGHDTGVALSWFDPTADQAEVLLGPGLNGGQVLGALEFPDAPRG